MDKVASAVASMSPMGKTSPSAGASTASIGQSPNLLTRWFRSRTGSVPSKPDGMKGRRRHRTQSEGEKDSPENQEIVSTSQNGGGSGSGSKETSPVKQVIAEGS